MTTYRKKLIEVALPLEQINTESLRRKQKAPKGFPTSFHKWWAQRPLAACRSVLFASLVDDPDDPEAPADYVAACRALPGDGDYALIHDTPRQRLFDFIVELVKWESSNDEKVIGKARELIMLSTGGNPPTVLDPFCGGGSIPLEAQRLGLTAYASDLNPVAVLITKALIEIPPKFANQPPVSLHSQWQPSSVKAKAKGGKLNLESGGYKGARGLAEDVRFYGQWMREQAEERLGKYYPKAKLPDGGEATVVAWIWARTVKCPNPACGCIMPLISNLDLSKKGRGGVSVRLVADDSHPPEIAFSVVNQLSDPAQVPKAGRGGIFRCAACGTATEDRHIKFEAMAGRMSARLMATVIEGKSGRVYMEPTLEQEAIALSVSPQWTPDAKMAENPRWFSPPAFGLITFGSLFTPRQLLALDELCALVGEARDMVLHDSIRAGLSMDTASSSNGGGRAQEYSDAIAVYLALAVDRVAYYNSSLATWLPKDNALRDSMPRQAVAMTWDFAEANPIAKSSGDISTCIEVVASYLDLATPNAIATVSQQAAQNRSGTKGGSLVCTDPPYYDNIGYSDLSDYFYVWLRRSLGNIYPDLFPTVVSPKQDELVATPYRHGSKKAAEDFFLSGMKTALAKLSRLSHREYPMTIYYAFKQSETDDGEGTSSTGWETFLQALLEVGLTVQGTWPMRTEGAGRMIAKGTNALATSIVLACRPRAADAPEATRQDFLRELRRELRPAVEKMQQGNIAPVDLAQAAIGPGMSIFSRYRRVLSAEGGEMSVREALQAINAELDSILSEGTEELDAQTRWAVAWYESYAYDTKEYGLAEQLSLSNNITVARLADSGIVESRAGKVRLLKREEYATEDWSPGEDSNLPTWELCQRLIQALAQHGSGPQKDKSGGWAPYVIMRAVGEEAREQARALAYRLYNFCERKGLSREGLAYNTLVQEWPELLKTMATDYGKEEPTLFQT